MVDPTKNVLDSLQAAVTRQDDLRMADREAQERHVDSIERELALRQDTRQRELADIKERHNVSRIGDRELLDAKLETLQEKFRSQDKILALMEEQRKERKEDDRRALEAALAAAEKARVATTEAGDKAITKTELSTAEQLKQQGNTSAQANSGIVALLNSLQTRVEKIENIKTGGNESTALAALAQAQAAAARTQMMMFAGLIITVILAVIGFAVAGPTP